MYFNKQAFSFALRFAFRWAFWYGYVILIQWVIYHWDLDAFRWACENGHLTLAQWLYKIKPTTHITTYYDTAFRDACINGHLNVVQWLYKIKPIDITANDEFAFRMACHYGHFELAQWLQTLIPYGLFYTFEVNQKKLITSYSTYKFNYSFIKKRLDMVHTGNGNEICFREALARNRFHPKYMHKWTDWGHEEPEDFYMMA